MTNKIFKLLSGFAALIILSAGTAFAEQCKPASVSATSKLYVSKTLGAYPGSWAAWRKKVKAEHGDGWQAWRRAKDQNINCEKVRNASGRNRWQCTRTAIPCRPGSGPVEVCDGPPIRSNLRRGDNNDQVKTLQCILKTYYGADIEVDGDFGRGTQAAVRAFQKKNGLSADGVVGNKTLEALL